MARFSLAVVLSSAHELIDNVCASILALLSVIVRDQSCLSHLFNNNTWDSLLCFYTYLVECFAS